MYKSVLLLIILGLSISLLSASNGAKKAQKKALTNAEEDLGDADFWDFDPHADAEKASVAQTDESNTIAPESKKSKSQQSKSTFEDLKQLVENLEQSIASLETKGTKRVHGARMLQDFPLTDSSSMLAPEDSIPSVKLQQSEEEQLFQTGESNQDEEEEEKETNVNNNTETGPLMPEKEENDSQGGQDEVGNGNDGQDEPETGVEQDEPQPEDSNGGDVSQNGGDTSDAGGQQEPEEQDQTDNTSVVNDTPNGMGTATLSGTIEYDTDFDQFDKKSGKEMFINSLASLVKVDTAAVRVINIRRGSVIFDFEITSSMASQNDRDNTVANIESMDKLIKEATRDGRMNFFNSAILDYKRDILVFSPPDSFDEPEGMGWIVTVAVLLSFIILGLICWLVIKQKKLNSDSKLMAKNIKYQVPSEQGRVDWESGPNMSVNDSDSIKFHPTSPPDVFNYEGRSSRQGGSPIQVSPSKVKIN